MNQANDNKVDLDPSVRRRRILFRAGHRGIKEMDILLTRFLDAELDAMGDEDLATFEAMLNIPDQEFYAILVKALRFLSLSTRP